MRVSVQLTTENLRQLEAADGYDRMGYREHVLQLNIKPFMYDIGLAYDDIVK